MTNGDRCTEIVIEAPSNYAAFNVLKSRRLQICQENGSYLAIVLHAKKDECVLEIIVQFFPDTHVLHTLGNAENVLQVVPKLYVLQCGLKLRTSL